MQNGHLMLIAIEHRNLEIRKHVTTSCSGTKPFYKLWVRGLDIRRRDTMFFAVLFIWPPSRAPPPPLRAQVCLPSASSKSRSFSLASITQVSNFLQISTNPCALPVRDVTRTPSPVLSRSIVTSEWHLHPPVRACVNTCLNVAPN